jgi:aminobenzoyl-glutamate transport protein
VLRCFVCYTDFKELMSRSEIPKRILSSLFKAIERFGNALPHPAILFALFSVGVILLSSLATRVGVQTRHPGSGEIIVPVDLLSLEGLHRILTEMVENFTGFAPLGTVLVAMLGIGIAESSGLIGAALRLLVLSSPRRLMTFVIVLTGVLSNTASEIGYVLLVPLGGMVFLALGRHPIAGLAAAFAGVSGGYSANLFLGTLDPLLAGLSQEAAQIIRPDYLVNPACNYYFMIASTFFIAGAGTWVTERIVVPRLGEYRGEEKPEELRPLSREEKRGLKYASVAGLLFAVLLLLGTVPANGYLRNPVDGGLLHSPFLEGIVAFIFLGAVILGVAFGLGAGTVRSSKDVIQGMAKAVETLGVYIVLVFFAAQFVAYFRWSNLGMILAIYGAEFLRAAPLGDVSLMLAFILVTAFINLSVGSASAKWAIMAPVFIPMFMLLGYTPEYVQAAYRVGDSVTNIISPMMSYFALIVAFAERYDKKAGVGTVIATMLPYSIAFLAVWMVLFVIWLVLGLPVGPGAGLYLPD